MSSHKYLRLPAIATLAVLIAAIPVACESDHRAEDIGVARIALGQVPGDARCLEIVAQGVRRVSARFSLLEGVGTTLAIAGLPLGDVQFSGSAFAEDCGASASTPPTWISDASMATIAKGVITEVTLIMHRNGRASIGIDFSDDADASVATGGATGSTGTGGSDIGGATGAGGLGQGGSAGDVGQGAMGGGVALSCTWRGDYDGDGVPDCLRTQPGTTQLDLVFNKGLVGDLYAAEPVVTPDALSPGFTTFAQFDLNHDSRMDIVGTYPDPIFTPYNLVLLISGQPDGTFLLLPKSPGSSPGVPLRGVLTSETVGDFYQDGSPDLLTLLKDPPVRDITLMEQWTWIVLASSGGTDFKVIVSPFWMGGPLRGFGPSIVSILDHPGGGSDIVSQFVVGPPFPPYLVNSVGISFGSPDGTFGLFNTIATGNSQVSVTDLNGDGLPDILLGSTPFLQPWTLRTITPGTDQ